MASSFFRSLRDYWIVREEAAPQPDTNQQTPVVLTVPADPEDPVDHWLQFLDYQEPPENDPNFVEWDYEALRAEFVDNPPEQPLTMGQLDRLYALCGYLELYTDFYLCDSSPTVEERVEHQRTQLRLQRMILEAPDYRRPVDVPRYWRFLSDPRRQFLQEGRARLALDPDNTDLAQRLRYQERKFANCREEREKVVRDFAQGVEARVWEVDNVLGGHQSFHDFRRSDVSSGADFPAFPAWIALPWYQSGLLYPDVGGQYKHIETLDLETIKKNLLESVPISELPSDKRECSICQVSYGEDESNHEEMPSRLPCGHSFGRECITSWLNEGQSSCPLCRREFNTELLNGEQGIENPWLLQLQVVYF